MKTPGGGGFKKFFYENGIKLEKTLLGTPQ